MANTNIEQSICDAIDIIVDKAISSASYDKTVQATIVSCVDATIGKYKVRYQDSTFYAYSGSSEITYTNGANVYVLIPGNDMSQDKTILGAVKKLGIDYVATAEGEEAYEVNGTNIITSTGEFTFSSYKEGTQVIVLYSKDNNDADNLISVDATAMNEYLKESEVIICGGVFRTDLPTEQQYRGNYGLIFALDFLDNTENQVVTRYYTVDVDNMTGNPYKLITDTRQYGIFEIDAENFIEINYISAFCYDFPNSLPDDECVDDIFISDIEMSGANRLSEDDLASYTLTFVTPQGTYFTKGGTNADTLTIEGQVRVKGKVIDNESQSLPFYWGVEHVGVTSQSEYYCKYLGQGWKCLNDYNIIEQVDEDDPMVVEWVPGSYKFTVKRTDIVAQEVRYKCAVIYDSTVITKTITIKNLGSDYEVYLESDCGTQFYFDIGYPTLTCTCFDYSTGIARDITKDCTYSWAVTNNVGNFSSISETPELNEDYNALYAEYTQLVADIGNGTKLPAANADLLAALEKSLKDYETIMRIEDNVIYHLNVNTITSFSTYQCSVFFNDYYLGTATITLLNTLSTEGTYSLVINNGCYVYKYNENGISPACDAVDDPIDIMTLTFTIYDNLGQPIDDDIAQHCDIQWIVPTENTLLKVSSDYDSYKTDNGNGTSTYRGLMSLAYTIADRYDITKQNNDIYLTVIYKDMALSAVTQLTFTKEGESGTNGTEYTVKIVPNVASGATPKYWIITQNPDGSYSHNFTPYSSGRYLKFQFYHNETLVLDGQRVTSSPVNTEEGKSVTVAWEVLANQYASGVQDDTTLTVTNPASGAFSIGAYNDQHPADIVKVTLVSEGVTYYATFPVIRVLIKNSNYRLNYKEGSGFLYAIYTSDGQSPKYDNTNPFEVVVEQQINGYWEDITTLSNSSYNVTYAWTYCGRTYGTAWAVRSYLENRNTSETQDKYQLYAKPADSYDGQCVTNAVQCTVFRSGTEVARIHIPVHLYLNRYGLAALNGWDGNSIQIDSSGGFILSPQVGAGIKESDNSFTGVLIGEVKESGKSASEIGLFGYSKGRRSIFLNAEDGSAIFGIEESGQIIIDPNGSAVIKSGDYSSSRGTGMEINFSSSDNGPYIKFGSGKFEVNSEGHITALGGGTIAGFNIDDDNFWTTVNGNSSLTNTSNFRLSSKGFERTINNITSSNDSDIASLVLASSNNFAVSSNGKMFAAYGVIGSGSTSNKIYLGNSTASTSNSALYTQNKTYFQTASKTRGDVNGFYLGTDGFAFGNRFSIEPNGSVQIIGGSIEIDDKNGDELFVANNGEIQLGDFYISADGTDTFAGSHFILSLDTASGIEGYPYIELDADTGQSTVIHSGWIVCTSYVQCYEVYPRQSWWQGSSRWWSLTEVCSTMWDDIDDLESRVSRLEREASWD